MRNLFFATMLGVVTVGCSSDVRTGSEPVYPASGTVSFRGQPVAGADVTFYNAENNRSAFGRTNDLGEYKLTTFSSNDGAVEGMHVVTITKLLAPPETTPAADIETEAYQPPGFGESTQPESPKSELPERYAEQASSGLNATITANGVNDKINFELTE